MGHIAEELAKEEAALGAVYFCPDHPVHGLGKYRRESEDRKPHPGMLLRAARVVRTEKGDAGLEKLKSDVQKYTTDEVHLNIVEIRKPEIDAKLVAENIAQQLERRVAFRRVMKRSVQTAMRLGALGIRITCSGRLGGAEIARVEWYREGRVPLHTLRADIDYGIATAFTTYGTCGVKVWIFKGEIMEHDPFATEKRQATEAEGGNRPPRERERAPAAAE